MAARAAVRDVARVLQVPYSEADKLAKMIPPPVQGRHIPLEKSIVENSELKSEYDNNPTAKRVFDMAIQLEGTIRSHGVHAAGVVYHGNSTPAAVFKELARIYRLPRWELRLDEHYLTGEALEDFYRLE
jgi:DNA polymerase III alpha subunit